MFVESKLHAVGSRVVVTCALLFACSCHPAAERAALDAASADVAPADAQHEDSGITASNFGCIEGLPMGVPADPVSPLPAVEPRLLWTRQVPGIGLPRRVVITDDRVSFVAGNRLFVLDRSGNDVAAFPESPHEPLMGLSADVSGNLYFAGAQAYSVSKDGALRWQIPFGSPLAGDLTAASMPLLDPTGTLYVSATDGFLYAIGSQDGSLKWKAQVGLAGAGPTATPAFLAGGAGPVFSARNASSGLALYRASDGKVLGKAAVASGPVSIWKFGYQDLGMVGLQTVENSSRWGRQAIYVLDQCGRVRWSLPGDRAQSPSLVGFDSRLVVTHRDPDRADGPVSLSMYDSGGALVAGPTAAGTGWFWGADNAIYAIACQQQQGSLSGPFRLTALNDTLAEQWHLDIEGECPSSGALASDGTMYLTRGPASGVELLAIRTQSPGLAPVAWPSAVHDNRGTAWLGSNDSSSFERAGGQNH